MNALADTNWLVAAYFLNDPLRSGIVERFSKRHGTAWLVSPASLLEAQNVFPGIARQASPPELKNLMTDVGTKLIVPPHSWESLALKTQELFSRFSHKGRFAAFDAMILASALQAGATHFLSFDTNSNLRALAAVLRLKVFPELTVEDRRRMAQFR